MSRDGKLRKPMKPTAVLLGDLNMLRCFVGSDIPVVLAATNPNDVTLASRFASHQHLIAPYADAERALADLERIAGDSRDKPVLFYGSDEHLLFVSRQRERLAASFRFRMPPADVIEAMVDKRGFAARASAAGLPVPATACSRDVAGVEQVLARVPVPCVIKPNVHIGWFKHVALHTTGPRKALIANTADELRARYAEVSQHTEDFVIQQYIPGGEDLIYSFHAYVDGSGRALAHFVGKKIRTFPRRGWHQHVPRARQGAARRRDRQRGRGEARAHRAAQDRHEDARRHARALRARGQRAIQSLALPRCRGGDQSAAARVRRAHRRADHGADRLRDRYSLAVVLRRSALVLAQLSPERRARLAVVARVASRAKGLRRVLVARSDAVGDVAAQISGRALRKRLTGARS